MITVNDVTKAFGPKKLFENVSTSFPPGRRYGLTGPNGAGKSTFMRILTGDIEPDTGYVGRPKKMGILRQNQFAYEEVRVLDVVVQGNKPLWAAIQEKERLLAKAELSNADGERLGELEGIVAEEDGYTAESDAGELLEGLGVPTSLHELPMKEAPNAYKVRVLLAQALFGKPQALLLDEPTNNLDIDSIKWLEKFLIAYEGTLVVISHDRRFLNEICTHIADIDYETIITYTGNYDDMVEAKISVRAKIDKENQEKSKKVAQLQDFVARFHAGTRASQVQSRMRQIDKLKLEAMKRSNIARPFIRFEIKRPSGKQTLTVEGLSKAYENKRLFKDFSFLVTRGERIALLGKSGSGKTTLLKMLAGEVTPDKGTIAWGHEAQRGFLPQDHEGQIAPGTTAFDWLKGLDAKSYDQDVRALLGRMLFSGEEGLKPTTTLSGGETVRLLFCRLMLLKDNVLLLDEPTNHLDLESISAVGEALEEYEGTCIVATHDRDMVARFATRIISLRGNGEVVDFNGSYDAYVEKYEKAPTTR
jgi:ATPase subunit of ABC transporter with duplicated ATPase domains